jgi:hypothetical protein
MFIASSRERYQAVYLFDSFHLFSNEQEQWRTHITAVVG